MRALSLVALCLATIGAYARPTVRAFGGGLEVPLSTPLVYESDLRVAVTIKNIGDKDLKIPKSGVVLDSKLPTPSLILDKGGKEDRSTGVMVCVPGFLASRCRLAHTLTRFRTTGFISPGSSFRE